VAILEQEKTNKKKGEEMISYKSQSSSRQLQEFFGEGVEVYDSSVDKELRVVESVVRAFLDFYPDLRNSETAMIDKIRNTNKAYASFKPSTIGRVMRHLQNDEGLFPPTDPEVVKKKMERSIEFRKHYTKQK
jgi:hypothetical protein